MFKTIRDTPTQDSQVELQNFTAVKEVLAT